LFSSSFRFILQIVSLLSATELRNVLQQILTARENLLVHRSVQSILSSLDRTVQFWLDPSSPERREAEAVLPAETGLSLEMVRHTLPLIFQEYRAEHLETLLRDELGEPQALDTFVSFPGGKRKAYGPSLITQVLAGNLPGAGLEGIIFALLVKSATLVKASSSAPFLPGRFARSLGDIDPELGSCLAVVTWPRGRGELEDIAFAQADVVLASGADESLSAIRSRVCGKFIGYGHKVSFSVIGKEVLSGARALAEKAAYDVALFDQQGCLSPQLIYVEEGGAVTAHEFATLLAQALAHWQSTLPCGRATLEESAAIQRVRDESEWQALAGKDVTLYASSGGTAWTVIYQADPVFMPSPLHRTVYVKPLASLTQLEVVLSRWRSYLEAVGVAVEPSRLVDIADLLGQAGVSRICPIGTLQIPPLSWRHGGRPRIADLVRWVGIEE
jgi:acyl-CoA reductase LuxC